MSQLRDSDKITFTSSRSVNGRAILDAVTEENILKPIDSAT